MCGGTICKLGTAKHHDKFLPGIDDLSTPGCFGMTELGHGSNVMGIETQVRACIWSLSLNHSLGGYTLNDMLHKVGQIKTGPTNHASACAVLWFRVIKQQACLYDRHLQATYDASRQEFVITTPSNTASKFWIGGAGQHGKVCTVFAQLTVNGRWQGPHVFVVRIRDDGGRLNPGELGTVAGS